MPVLLFFIYCIYDKVLEQTKNTFRGTWYLPHSFGDSAVNKSKIPIFYIAHAIKGHISTSGQKFDVTIVFPDPNFL